MLLRLQNYLQPVCPRRPSECRAASLNIDGNGPLVPADPRQLVDAAREGDHPELPDRQDANRFHITFKGESGTGLAGGPLPGRYRDWNEAAGAATRPVSLEPVRIDSDLLPQVRACMQG